MSIKITASFTVPDDSVELAQALAKFGATTNDGETSRTVDHHYLRRNSGQPVVVGFTCSFGIEARRHVEYLSPDIAPSNGAGIVGRPPREVLLDAVRRNLSVLKDLTVVIHDEQHVANPINEPPRAPKL